MIIVGFSPGTRRALSTSALQTESSGPVKYLELLDGIPNFFSHLTSLCRTTMGRTGIGPLQDRIRVVEHGKV
jgi:hypothetical protein